MEDADFEKYKFMKKVEKEEKCWIFKGGLNAKKPKGYGVAYYKGNRILAHRLSYQLYIGDIPNGMYVLHNCPNGDNRACVNPDHLWLGTYKDNSIDAMKKGRLTKVWGRKKTQEEIDKIQKNRKIPNQKGERHNRAKLKEFQVLEIREKLSNKVKYKEISKEYGIDICSISDIKFKRTWRHI